MQHSPPLRQDEGYFFRIGPIRFFQFVVESISCVVYLNTLPLDLESCLDKPTTERLQCLLLN